MNSALRDALREAAVRHGGRSPPQPSSRLARLAARLDLPDGSIKSAGKNYDEIAERMLERLTSGGSLSPNEARDAAWCLWETRTRLTDTNTVLSAYLRQVRSLHRRSPVRSLALSYLYSFAEDRDGLTAVAEALKHLIEVAGKPFDALQRAFSIFDPRTGPRAVAREAHASRTAPSRVLESYGLNALSVRAGFAEACALESLKRLAGDARIDAKERISLIKEIALDAGGNLYFPKHGPHVANALLLPFEHAQPAEDICDRYLDLLLGLFGDPRTNEGRWVSMPEAAEIARRWLTRQALRQFLDIVGEVADKRMWRYRRAFWEAVYNRKLIQTAWVVFDPYGVDAARRKFGSKVRFGSFAKGGGVQAGQSALLLRIGQGVVAEWSHNGSCRIWDEYNRRGAPSLYASNYHAEELRHGTGYRPELSKPHGQAETYSWQRLVAQKIYEMTGVRIAESEYRV